MNPTQRRINRIRQSLRAIIDDVGTPSIPIEEIPRRVADLLLSALDNPNHPLAERLGELIPLVPMDAEVQPPALEPSQPTTSEPDGEPSEAPTEGESREGAREGNCRPGSADRQSSEPPPPAPTPPAGRPRSAHILFMPQPGSDGIRDRFWPLQLLLHVAACSPRAEDVAGKLGITLQKLRAAVEVAKQLPSVALWTQREHLKYLDAALDELDYPPPEARLEGQDLVVSGVRVRLSKLQVRIAAALLANPDEGCTPERLQTAGVCRPVPAISDLRKKLRQHDVPLDIILEGGRYRFSSSESAGSYA